MGDPSNTCIKPSSPFLSWTTSTTSTTTTVEPDFFLLPYSGGNCPKPKINSSNQVSYQVLEPPLINSTLTFICSSGAYENDPCELTTQKFIKVAHIDLNPKICEIFKIDLSGEQKDNFLINNLDLYIHGSLLDFHQPSGNRSITVQLINPLSLELIDSQLYTVNVIPCDQCFE